MSGEFLGTYSSSINKKKWITIPADFKRKFSTAAKQKVVITIGPNKNIAIYPLDNWNKKMEQLSRGDKKAVKLKFNLQNFANLPQKLEVNGRVKISKRLLKFANITTKAMVKGEGNYISVWNPERFEAFTQQIIEDHVKLFDSLDYQ